MVPSAKPHSQLELWQVGEGGRDGWETRPKSRRKRGPGLGPICGSFSFLFFLAQSSLLIQFFLHLRKQRFSPAARWEDEREQQLMGSGAGRRLRVAPKGGGSINTIFDNLIPFVSALHINFSTAQTSFTRLKNRPPTQKPARIGGNPLNAVGRAGLTHGAPVPLWLKRRPARHDVGVGLGDQGRPRGRRPGRLSQPQTL